MSSGFPARAPSPTSISIIIPTYNEAGHIGALLRHLRAAVGEEEEALEILVSDAHSPDATAAEATQAGGRVVQCPRKGRAAQLNFGAHHATGDILYFLHADTYPPAGFTHAIRAAVARGAGAGCFRLVFDHPSWLLKSNAWFTRFNTRLFRFGDQSLFVRQELFARAGGYREDMTVFEDQDITQRLSWLAPFRVLPGPVVTSARKYRSNGVWRLQGIYYLLTAMYLAGASQQRMVAVYRALIRQDKV